MNGLRLKITLLVAGAIIAMSVIGVAATFSVSGMPGDIRPVAFRYHADSPLQSYSGLSGGSVFAPAAITEPPAIALAYILLIVAGSIFVGLAVANMVVRPLAILEKAVNSVDPHGFIPPIAEKGLGEDLEAARLLNRLSSRLKLAMETRMRLVAAAGHDLRTPITRMRLRLEFMDESEEKGLWARDIDEMAHIADSAIKLVKEETGAVGEEPIELDVLLHDLCGELAEIGHAVTVTDVDCARIKGGHHSVKRALSNLIVNACTHGDAASVCLLNDGTQAVIRIKDEGPGIPEDLIPRAFEPFFRASPGRERKVKGAGLGLAIANEIVTRYGGTISIANRPNGGLIQTVRLPLAG